MSTKVLGMSPKVATINYILVIIFSQVKPAPTIYSFTNKDYTEFGKSLNFLLDFLYFLINNVDMDYFISEEQRKLKETAARIAQEKIAPQRRELDKLDKFPHEILRELAENGMFKTFIPKDYGGSSSSTLDLCLAVEEIARVCAGVGTAYAATALAATPIIFFGNESQKSKYLSKIAEGTIASYGLTESQAGSDVAGIQTKAVKDRDSYIRNGGKQFITNGGEAEIYVVFASTNPKRGARGLSAFIVEKDTPGFSFGKLEDKLGIRSAYTRELIFEDCKVSSSNILSKEGFGFIVAMRTFDYTRPGVAALSVGVAQGALDEVMKYREIISFERTQFMIAELTAKVEAARAFVYAAARHIDSGAKNISRYSAMSKLFASDMAMEVTSKAVEIFGLSGCSEDYPVAKMFRDAKITQIYEGTNEIQTAVIGRELTR